MNLSCIDFLDTIQGSVEYDFGFNLPVERMRCKGLDCASALGKHRDCFWGCVPVAFHSLPDYLLDEKRFKNVTSQGDPRLPFSFCGGGQAFGTKAQRRKEQQSDMCSWRLFADRAKHSQSTFVVLSQQSFQTLPLQRIYQFNVLSQ
jgi:hypothetical protein